MESEITLKEYWAHVGELLKYLVKYFGIAVADTFNSVWRGIIKLGVKTHLLIPVDDADDDFEEELEEEMNDDVLDDTEETVIEEKDNTSTDTASNSESNIQTAEQASEPEPKKRGLKALLMKWLCDDDDEEDEENEEDFFDEMEETESIPPYSEPKVIEFDNINEEQNESEVSDESKTSNNTLAQFADKLLEGIDTTNENASVHATFHDDDI